MVRGITAVDSSKNDLTMHKEVPTCAALRVVEMHILAARRLHRPPKAS